MSDDFLLRWATDDGYENHFLRASDGTLLRVVSGGVATGPRLVFLHGAPQMAFGWRRVLHDLRADARLIAPDLRGYGASELAMSGRYDRVILAQDVDDVLDATGDDPVVLIGHDWGGIIAWHYAQTRPARVAQLVIINAPHPAAYRRSLGHAAQARRSWYVGAALIPGVETWLARHDAAVLERLLIASAPKNLWSSSDLETYRRAFARPGRVAAVLAYYRQEFPVSWTTFRHGFRAPRIAVPTTILWGEEDRALASCQPDLAALYVDTLRLRRLPGVSHWVPEECPGEVVKVVREALVTARRESCPSPIPLGHYSTNDKEEKFYRPACFGLGPIC